MLLFGKVPIVVFICDITDFLLYRNGINPQGRDLCRGENMYKVPEHLAGSIKDILNSIGFFVCMPVSNSTQYQMSYQTWVLSQTLFRRFCLHRQKCSKFNSLQIGQVPELALGCNW